MSARSNHVGANPSHAAPLTPEQITNGDGPVVRLPYPPTRPISLSPTEDLLTQPTADVLLANPSEAVTVRLPGADTSFQAIASSPMSTPAGATNGATVLYTSPLVPPLRELSVAPPPDTFVNVATQSIPINDSSSIPLFNGQTFLENSQPSPQYATINGSENGSISSTGHFVPAPPSQFLPPGIGMTTNGDCYNLSSGAPVDFHPARPFYPTHPRSFPQHQQQFIPPQSYSPEPFTHQQRNSFSSPQAPFFPSPNGFSDGRAGSPFGNPYGRAQMGGYFTPARPAQKISIRAPTANGVDAPKAADSPKSNGQEIYPSIQPQPQVQGYYSQPYNPYAVNGIGMQMSMANPAEGAYSDGSGYGYQPQQYSGVPAGYAYEGEYPGY